MDKQIITFSANEQNLVRIGGEYHYSSNKVSYIGAHFDLGANWDGFDSVRAVWFTDRINGILTVLDGEGNCTVPTEVLKKKDRVFVNLVGSIVSNGELTDRLTTYPAVALVVDSKAKVDSTETAPVTPSQFEQFVSIVQDAVANIKDIVSTTLNADYTLTFVYSDGTSYTTPSIRGERGPQGADGADGTDGNGIASAVLNSNYTLTLTFTDGTSYTTPSIRGAQGPKGDPGDVSQAQLDAAVSDLKSNYTSILGCTYVPYDHKDYRLNVKDSPADVTNFISASGVECVVVACSEGDQFMVTAKSLSGARAYGFVKTDGTVLGYAGASETLDHAILTAPYGTAYFVSNNQYSTYRGSVVKASPKFTKEAIALLTNETKDLHESLFFLADTQKKLYYTKESISGSVVAQVYADLPAGNYDIVADTITSSDTVNPAYNYMSFRKANGTEVLNRSISRDTKKASISLSDDVAYFYIYASNNSTNSQGKTFSVTNLKIYSDSELNKRLNQHLGSTSDLEYSFVPNSNFSDLTVMGDQILCFKASDSNGTGTIFVYSVDFENKTNTLIKKVYHHWGHCNSVDYNPKNDCLFLAYEYNYGGVYEADKFYIIPSFSTLLNGTAHNATIAELANCAIEYDCISYSYGEYLNGCWGSSNYGANDLIIIFTNKCNNYRILQLGKGSTDLGLGVYEEASDGAFNGSFAVIKEFTLDYVNTSRVNQGAQFYNGVLYLGMGHYHDLYWLVELKPNGVASIINERYMPITDSSGELQSGSTEGIAITQYFMITNITTPLGNIVEIHHR